MQLNPQQRLAVTECERPTLIIAGAGTGKTGVITQKIQWLINRSGVSASNIVAVTFTNKAAREMRHRLASMLDEKTTRGLSISTFHRLGLRLLQQDGDSLGLRRGFTIVDQSDALATIKSIVGEHNLPVDERVAQSHISTWKNDIINAEQALSVVENPEQATSAEVYRRYSAFLSACNSVDFDDLVTLPVQLLKADEKVRLKWQQRIQQLLVDEYQDTNSAQYELVRLLTGNGAVLTAVGDDDQSIYSWRGANPENLGQLQRDFPTLEVVKLEQNYRSNQRILRCANTLIENNPHLFPKRLWSEQPPGDPIRVSQCNDAADEADWISADILNMRFRRKSRYGDFAILYRNNFQSRLFEQALREKQIPYSVTGGPSFFERTEVRDVMSYLKLMVNQDDDTSFLRIVNTPRREIGASTLEKLGRAAQQAGTALLTTCLDTALRENLAGRACDRLEHFANWLILSADNAERGDIVGVLEQMLVDIDYRAWLSDQANTEEQAERAWENVQELIEWIRRQLVHDSSDSKSLADLVHQIMLMDMLTGKDSDNEADRVQLMTLHSAKGLEFPSVYLVGFEEGVLPHRNSIDAETVDEERRLAYVGITRARYALTLTFTRTRQRFGETIQSEPSRFLEELPADDLIHLGDIPSAERVAENQQAGRETLSSLKALLLDTGGEGN